RKGTGRMNVVQRLSSVAACSRQRGSDHLQRFVRGLKPMMICTMTRKGQKHRFWHRWRSVRRSICGDGHTTYQQCQSCRARRVLQKPGGYQPVDWDWVAGKSELSSNA